MQLAFAARVDFEIEQMDVPDAYLKKDLRETIVTGIPDGFEVLGREDQMLRLLRPLYSTL